MTPKRIQLKRTKGWRKPDGCIVVARPSRWGNPYRWEDYRGDYESETDAVLRWMAVQDFKGMLEGNWGTAHKYPTEKLIRLHLRGHDLGCWCPLSDACHADVLLQIANGP